MRRTVIGDHYRSILMLTALAEHGIDFESSGESDKLATDRFIYLNVDEKSSDLELEVGEEFHLTPEVTENLRQLGRECHLYFRITRTKGKSLKVNLGFYWKWNLSVSAFYYETAYLMSRIFDIIYGEYVTLGRYERPTKTKEEADREIGKIIAKPNVKRGALGLSQKYYYFSEERHCDENNSIHAEHQLILKTNDTLRRMKFEFGYSDNIKLSIDEDEAIKSWIREEQIIDVYRCMVRDVGNVKRDVFDYLTNRAFTVNGMDYSISFKVEEELLYVYKENTALDVDEEE